MGRLLACGDKLNCYRRGRYYVRTLQSVLWARLTGTTAPSKKGRVSFGVVKGMCISTVAVACPCLQGVWILDVWLRAHTVIA